MGNFRWLAWSASIGIESVRVCVWGAVSGIDPMTNAYSNWYSASVWHFEEGGGSFVWGAGEGRWVP